MATFDLLRERGFFYQLTDEAEIRQRLDGGRVTFYIGFDPTANSLHVGHLLPVMAARFLQQAGHRPVILVGGGTALVGDPSGKTEMRQMLTRETIAQNAEAIKGQMARYLTFGGDQALMVNNADWLAGLNYIEFLRDIGKHFSVNKMLQADSVKLRLETGLSFLEFNYMLLQAYDFYHLCNAHNCDFQFGGQDQWGNIVAGTDLVRRMLGRTGYGATFPLLTNSAGQKFGKSVAGAVWLDATRTSVFDYYQFWRNVDDVDVARLLKLFTALPVAEIDQLAGPGGNINRAKEILAYEATTLAHGAELARDQYLAAGRQFGFADAAGQVPTTSAIAAIAATGRQENLPTITLTAEALGAGIGVLALFVQAGLAKSNGEARRLLEGGGAYLNDVAVKDVTLKVSTADLVDGQLMLRAGKKNVRRVVVG